MSNEKVSAAPAGAGNSEAPEAQIESDLSHRLHCLSESFDLTSSHVSAAHREIITRDPASHGPRQTNVKGIHAVDEAVGERGLACQ